MKQSSVQKFNKLHNGTWSRIYLKKIITQAEKEKEVEVLRRLNALLDSNPDAVEFILTIDTPVKPYKMPSLGAARHTGLAKEGLSDCGRLKPGFKYEKGGKIVKVEKKANIKKSTSTKSKKPNTLKHIEILWAEGDNSKYDKFPKKYTSWNLANKAVIPILDPEPGYNKVSFIVVWQDGETYEGRLDVSITEDNPTLTKNVFGQHIYDTLMYDITHPADWIKPSLVKEYKEFLKNYDLGTINKNTKETKLLSLLAKFSNDANLELKEIDKKRPTRKFKVGDLYRSDFDYYGMLLFASKITAKTPLRILKKLYDSFEDVNYHYLSKTLSEAISIIEKTPLKETESPEALGVPFLSHAEQRAMGKDEVGGLGKAVSSNDIYQMITDQILKAIEDHGDLTWYSGRNTKGSKDSFVNLPMPINYNINKYYRGINAFMLSHYPVVKSVKKVGTKIIKDIELQLITDNRLFWMTFSQITKEKAKLKKGAVGMDAVFYNFSYKLDGKSISEAKYKELYAEFNCSPRKLNDKNCERLSKNAFLKYYKVFNERDIEGVDFDLRRKKIEAKAKKFETEVEKIDAAESIIKNMPNAPKIIEKYIGKGQSPNYKPTRDIVEMPQKTQYDNVAIWYGTAFHELCHATGHATRLGREGITNFDGFGSPSYAFEELVAELGSAFLNAESGILFQTLKMNAAYIKGWKESVKSILKKDNKAIFKAAGQAQKAADYILDRDSKGKPKFYNDLKSKTQSKPVVAKVETTKKRRSKSTKTENRQMALFGVAKRKKKSQKVGSKNLGTVVVSVPVGETQPNVQNGAIEGLAPFAVIENTNTPTEPKQNNTDPVEKTKKPNVSGLQNLRELRKNTKEVKYFSLNGELSKFLGKIERKPKHSVVITLDAPPGSGKTRVLFQALDMCADAGLHSVFASLEEHPESGLFQEKEELYIKPQNIDYITPIDDLPPTYKEFLDTIKNFDVIAIDSWNKVFENYKGIDFDNDLRKALDGKIIITIFQRTQNGQMRGGSRAAFDGDIILEVNAKPSFKDSYVVARKNRYQNIPLDEIGYNFYRKESFNPKVDSELKEIPENSSLMI